MPDQLPEPKIMVPFENENVKIHTFVSSEPFISNATHIIETKNSLVIIDGQFVVPYAMQFRAYADSLNKPIARVYLSHDHPDHFFGLGAAFADCEIYALPETIKFLKEYGEAIRSQSAQAYGPLVTEKLAIPQHEITEGTETIDGLKYEYVIHKHTETEYHLSIKLPEINIFIVQDLIYSGAHVYITKDLDNWMNQLRSFIDSDYGLFLAGHGEPADKKEIQNNIDYLQKAKELLADNPKPEDFKKALLDAFPNRTGAAVFDIYLPRLFGNEGH
jgi:glyoxylase-like metal-dependent hydrolase (beta-lactamase superfamily II)